MIHLRLMHGKCVPVHLSSDCKRARWTCREAKILIQCSAGRITSQEGVVGSSRGHWQTCKARTVGVTNALGCCAGQFSGQRTAQRGAHSSDGRQVTRKVLLNAQMTPGSSGNAVTGLRSVNDSVRVMHVVGRLHGLA